MVLWTMFSGNLVTFASRIVSFVISGDGHSIRKTDVKFSDFVKLSDNLLSGCSMCSVTVDLSYVASWI